MCGIAGLYCKSPALEEHLGEHLADMLEQLADRGPDSAGAAIYREPAAPGRLKASLLSADGRELRWEDLAAAAGATVLAAHGDHAVLELHEDALGALARPDVLLLGTGRSIELHKRAGHPASLVEHCGLRGLAGTHGLGHTRMATESRVTTAGSHPFSTGADLCLVHNGSLSNHNRLRLRLRRAGVVFQTENDSEVAAGYLTWRLAEGDGLEQALERALVDLDGFFTFAVGTADGFAVLRDPIACKPAVIAETDDWVAMASEHRALAVLPGAGDAELFEPEPGVVYTWARTPVAA